METGLYNSPLSAVQADFGSYINKMRMRDDAHRVNGIPDYAFALDYKLREQIRKLPFFYTLSKKVAEQSEALMRQVHIANAIQAGPNQFPDIYEMAADCAKRLGIGSPNVFILHDQSINAYTYAGETVSPMIVIHSGLIERMTPGELKCVIAHECAHVQNEHTVYQSIYNLIMGTLVNVNSISASVLALISETTYLLLHSWYRAAEVTCDRAAMICADNIEDAIRVNKKLAYGTFINREEEVSIEEVRKQFNDLSATVSLFTELQSTHPAAIRRILLSEEFTRCDVLYKWRPEFKKPDMIVYSKEECDKICEKYTAVIKEERGKAK